MDFESGCRYNQKFVFCVLNADVDDMRFHEINRAGVNLLLAISVRRTGNSTWQRDVINRAIIGKDMRLYGIRGSGYRCRFLTDIGNNVS